MKEGMHKRQGCIVETFSMSQTQNLKWIENLALEEISMEESGIVHLNDHLSPDYFLEESSIRFMDQVRELCDIYVSRFNEYRSHMQHNAQIKVFKISNTVNDFMLFRNSLRLVFSRKALDLVTIGFLTADGKLYAPRINGRSEITQGHHEINAHVGPYNKVTWRFAGEEVTIEAMVKHYMTEFIRSSTR